jgi:hypothetical protein
LGKLPHFQRKLGDRLDLLTVTIDDAGGSLVIDLGRSVTDGLAEGDWTSLALEKITVAHLDRAARYRLPPSGRMSLDASRTEGLRREVKEFWDLHLPILQSVSGDYAFLALCLDKESGSFGAIMRGDASDF